MTQIFLKVVQDLKDDLKHDFARLDMWPGARNHVSGLEQLFRWKTFLEKKSLSYNPFSRKDIGIIGHVAVKYFD